MNDGDYMTEKVLKILVEREIKLNEERAIPFGTHEWSDCTANILKGCSHDCKYCYAKEMAIRFKRSTVESWNQEELNYPYLKKEFSSQNKVVMFPSTHDIVPKYLQESLQFIGKLVSSHQKVLIVTKPHLECVEAICDKFQDSKSKILFRFTIGSSSTETLKFWEPGAPGLDERLSSLKHAHCKGFSTSISCEPMLDGNISELISMVSPYVTESIWLGKMNFPQRRLKVNGVLDTEMEKALANLLATQTDKNILNLYQLNKKNPNIKWKESIKKVVGLAE